MIKHVWLLCVPLLWLTSCRQQGGAQLQDFDRQVYTPEYASGFDIRGAEGCSSVLITVTDPWQGADSVRTCLFLARDNEPVPEGFRGQVLRGDARHLVVMSSTHVAMLDAVGAVDRIAGVSGLDFITSPALLARRDSVGDVGFEGNVNYEQLLALDTDLVLLYGVNSASAMEGKLSELGIPYIYIGDYVEESPLGKAEWMVLLGELTGRREEGERVFRALPPRYNAWKQKVTEMVTDAPSVMMNTPYNGTWFMPSARSYAVRLVEDAGGAYIYGRNTGNASTPIDLEEAYLLTSAADVWINVGRARSLAEVAEQCPKFTDTRCFRSGRVYNNTLRCTPAGGNDYYESAVVHPDLLLRDLVKIFHPELVDDEFVYYEPLR